MNSSSTQFRRKLLKWYDGNRRLLPWRPPPGAPIGAVPPAYHVMISEAMLQQTQVATVIPYFERFIRKLPDVASLARADDQQVLKLWQGLGYYSRARNLIRAAVELVNRFNSEIPDSVEALMSLPGVGRYTAGAIASIAFNRRAPIVDGNVVRVLCRLDDVRSDPRTKVARDRLWARAEEILPSKRCGDFNSALMELGATVCTPRNPKCDSCPVRAHCRAAETGDPGEIPPKKSRKPTPVEHRDVFCLMNSAKSGVKLLIQRRPATGRWAGMWQFPTTATGTPSNPAPPALSAEIHGRFRLTPLGMISHQLTHRTYRFSIYAGQTSRKTSAEFGDASALRWVTVQELDEYPLPRPHERILELWTRENPQLRAARQSRIVRESQPEPRGLPRE